MSTKKRPSDGELRGMLLEGHFGQPKDLRIADPLAPTHMHVEIERIKPYDRNPRRVPNPLYAQIKTSIRNKRGLDDPIGITRRPGDNLYTVRAGGNTRLSILKELWQETEDSAFSRAYCLFVPWTCESDCIAGHLIENELRGELLFVDKANALKGLLVQTEAESGGPLSRNEFLRRLAEIGYPISKRQWIRYEYTADVLERIIPEALQAGLGGRQIDEIRTAERHYREYWMHCGLDPDDFARLFQATLSEHDSDGWSLRLALDDLEIRISENAGKAFNLVRMEVDAMIAGVQRYSLVSENSRRPESNDSVLASGAAKSPDESLYSVGFDATASDAASADIEIDRIGETTPGLENSEKPVLLTDMKPDHGTLDESENVPQFLSRELNRSREKKSFGSDLKSLRSRACVLATRFAQSFNCERLIRPVPQGHGFFLEMPDRPIRDAGEMAWWGWWLLLSLSEQAITKARLELAPRGMRFPERFIEDRLDEVFFLTGPPPDAIHTLGHTFLTSPQLSERAFLDLLMLIETCRAIRNRFSESDLWRCSSIDPLQKEEQI